MTPREFSAIMQRHRQARTWDDLQSAKISSLIANVNRDRKKKKEPYTAEDFMFMKSDDTKAQSVDDMERHLLMLTKQMGGKIVGDVSNIKAKRREDGQNA